MPKSRPITAALVALLLLCFRRVGVHGSGQNKRQMHHTPAPTHTHTTAPSDPLAAWMSSTSSSKPNVLFLIADDYRPKMGAYGESNMVTPNLDSLASRSVRFDQAFAQQALCAPSRASFLTGRRPETTRTFDLYTYFRKVAGNFMTLPQYFKNHGYMSVGVGKIFHQGRASGFTDDYPYSWSIRPYLGDQPFSWDMLTQHMYRPVNETETGKLRDTDIADYAVNFLKQHSQNRDQPFFLAVGFHKPHLPWIYPKEFLDLYPLSKIHLAAHRIKPPTVPDIAWSKSLELRLYQDFNDLNIPYPYGIIPDDYQFKMRQAYSAAASYLDSNVGRVLHALNQYNFAGNTIVSFLGDHGWHLGDNAEWCKQTNYDMALRIPMMIYVPGVTSIGHNFTFIDALAPGFDPSHDITQHVGSQYTTEELVEAVDLFPTLTELAGLPVPNTCPENSLHTPTCTEGTSLVPLIRKVRNLTNGESFTWKKAAYSFYPREWDSDNPVMGYTIRTNTHRYTEWVSYNRTLFKPDFNQSLGQELYRHSDDPFEFTNLAQNPDSSATVSQLSQMLREGWRATLQDYLQSVH